MILEYVRWKEWIHSISIILVGFYLVIPSVFPALLLILIFFLVSSFGFLINDYFDADFDKLNKNTRNPISKGIARKQSIGLLCVILFLISVISASFLSNLSFLMIVFLILGYYLYSAKNFRFKEKFVGTIIHGLSGLFWFLAAYFLAGHANLEALLFSVFFFIASYVMGLTSEIRDLAVDAKSKFKTTAIILGYDNSLNLIRALAVIAIVIFFSAVLLFLPAIFLLYLAIFGFYIKMLFFSRLGQEDLFEKTMISWNQGKILFLIISIFVVIVLFGKLF